MSLKLDTRHVGGITVLDASGRITLGEGSNTIRTAVRDLIAAGNRNIVLNLTDVSYIDSSGFGELVASYTSATKAGGTLKLHSPTRRVKDLLRITNLEALFEVHDDEARALRSFA